MEINDLIKLIIPPNNRENRDGFSNIHYLNKLTLEEKEKVEDVLINEIKITDKKRIDDLMVDTLGFLRTEKALPLLRDLLDSDVYEDLKIPIITAIYLISNDKEMIDKVIDQVKKIEKIKDQYSTFRLIDTFYYLIKFNEYRTRKFINEYTDNSDFLVSYNARNALSMADFGQ